MCPHVHTCAPVVQEEDKKEKQEAGYQHTHISALWKNNLTLGQALSPSILFDAEQQLLQVDGCAAGLHPGPGCIAACCLQPASFAAAGCQVLALCDMQCTCLLYM